MSNIWPHVTPKSPCPICGKTDWCQIGDKSIKCMRVESPNSCRTGGWYHFTEERITPPPPLRRFQKVVNLNAGMQLATWKEQTQLFQLEAFAESLGVLVESVIALGASWASYYQAWAFPMRDGEGQIIGIRLRGLDGRKWAVIGSRQGLFIPQDVRAAEPVYICEGPTDTAAALSMGLYAIGRPSCNCGCEQIRIALKNLNVKDVVIVADNDEVKANGTMPGLDGAKKLQRELGRLSRVFIPPAKDIREFLQIGGTAKMIESIINSKPRARE